jgi:hypothetical protein
MTTFDRDVLLAEATSLLEKNTAASLDSRLDKAVPTSESSEDLPVAGLETLSVETAEYHHLALMFPPELLPPEDLLEEVFANLYAGTYEVLEILGDGAFSEDYLVATANAYTFWCVLDRIAYTLFINVMTSSALAAVTSTGPIEDSIADLTSAAQAGEALVTYGRYAALSRQLIVDHAIDTKLGTKLSSVTD